MSGASGTSLLLSSDLPEYLPNAPTDTTGTADPTSPSTASTASSVAHEAIHRPRADHPQVGETSSTSESNSTLSLWGSLSITSEQKS